MSIGTIYWMFKGKQMRTERAFIRTCLTPTQLLVDTLTDERQQYNFIRTNKKWLLKDHTSPNSLLYGTCFVENT